LGLSINKGEGSVPATLSNGGEKNLPLSKKERGGEASPYYLYSFKKWKKKTKQRIERRKEEKCFTPLIGNGGGFEKKGGVLLYFARQKHAGRGKGKGGETGFFVLPP